MITLLKGFTFIVSFYISLILNQVSTIIELN